MLEKRIAIVGMLMEECSTYEISRELKVSVATILKIEAAIGRGAYLSVQQILKRRARARTIAGKLEKAITFGMSGGPQKHVRKKLHRKVHKLRAGGSNK